MSKVRQNTCKVQEDDLQVWHEIHDDIENEYLNSWERYIQEEVQKYQGSRPVKAETNLLVSY